MPAATPPPASPARTSGLIGKDYKAQASAEDGGANNNNDTAPTSSEDAEDGEPTMTTGQKLASWWENKAKPGLAAFSSDSRRRMTVWK